MIPLKMSQMQGASFPRKGVLSVRRSDEEIEATQQMGYFQRNHDSNLAPTGIGLNSAQGIRLFPGH